MTRDMTEGSISRHLLIYAAPLVFGNLFQQLYQTVDSVVVGHFNGKEALAAVGAAGPVMNILTFLFVGITMGTSILMSQYFGARQYDKLREELGTSLTAGLILTAFLTLASFFGSSLLIRLTQTPAEIAPLSANYLRIICAGLIFTFLYNLLSSALRAIGDSTAPLLVLILTTIVNIFLDLFLVGVLHLGVSGAAIATVLSQAVSALALFFWILLRTPLLHFTRHDLRINRTLLRITIDFSSVSAVQQTVLYVGRLLIQSGVNALGVDAVAAFNAVSIIDSYVLAPGDSLAASLTTFSAQNKGAGHNDRIPGGLRAMLAMTECYTISITLFVLFFRRSLLGLFLKPEEEGAILLGLSYLVPMASCYFLTGICNSFQGHFRGVGNLKITLAATLLQIPIRVVLSYALLPVLGIQAVAVGTAVGWVCMAGFEGVVYGREKGSMSPRNFS